MSQGVIISKENSSIDGLPEDLYVDPTYSLLKVRQNVTGSISTDGTTVNFYGDYKFVDNGFDFSNRRSFTLNIPLDIDYIPIVMAYMDQKSQSRRMKLSSYLSGVGLEGDLRASMLINVVGGKPVISIYASMVAIGVLTAGEYGYFIQIEYDRGERRLK